MFAMGGCYHPGGQAHRARNKGEFLSDRTVSGRATHLIPDPATARAEMIPLVADRLQQVEESFRRNLASPIHIVDEIGEFVAQGAGKRVRPTLHLLCGQLCS